MFNNPNVLPREPTQMELERKPGIFTLMKPGYTLDGVFDPEHDDFKCCCHIHAMYFVYYDPSTLAVLDLIFGLIAYSTLFLGIFFWKQFYKCLKIIMFYLFLWTFLYVGSLFYIIAYVVVAIATKTDPKIMEAKELGYLLSAIIVSFELFINLSTLYAIYVEFKYLQGRIKNGLT
uniref:Uncharacterized protein n=1 Tax=Panagrolaimus sp. JU765 TaxID=591449 RepID=A0AC34Q825_9BILA